MRTAFRSRSDIHQQLGRGQCWCLFYLWTNGFVFQRWRPWFLSERSLTSGQCCFMCHLTHLKGDRRMKIFRSHNLVTYNVYIVMVTEDCIMAIATKQQKWKWINEYNKNRERKEKKMSFSLGFKCFHSSVLTFLIIILCAAAKKQKGIKFLRVILINYVWCSEMAWNILFKL